MRSRVDLRDEFPVVRDQGPLQACTAVQLSDLIGWSLDRHRRARSGGRMDSAFSPSALFVYYNARKRTGHHNCNAPVRPSDAVAAVIESGVCSEELWPFDYPRYRERPPDRAYDSASELEVEFRSVAQDAGQLKHSLDHGVAFFFSLRLFASNCWEFERGETAVTGRMKMPRPHELAVRNHAVLAVGYDDSCSSFLVRNDFGPDWGIEGHALVPYDYLADPMKAYAFRTVEASHPTFPGALSGADSSRATSRSKPSPTTA